MTMRFVYEDEVNPKPGLAREPAPLCLDIELPYRSRLSGELEQ
jgi:hypothetical protein